MHFKKNQQNTVISWLYICIKGLIDITNDKYFVQIIYVKKLSATINIPKTHEVKSTGFRDGTSLHKTGTVDSVPSHFD